MAANWYGGKGPGFSPAAAGKGGGFGKGAGKAPAQIRPSAPVQNSAPMMSLPAMAMNPSKGAAKGGTKGAGGGGGGKGAASAFSRDVPAQQWSQDQEQELIEAAMALHDQLLDLNIAEDDLSWQWEQVAQLRRSVLMAYGVAPSQPPPQARQQQQKQQKQQVAMRGGAQSKGGHAQGGAGQWGGCAGHWEGGGCGAFEGGGGGFGGGFAEAEWGGYAGFGGGAAHGGFGGGCGCGGGAFGGQQAPPDEAFRAKLNQMMCKRAGRPATKGEVAFETHEVGGGYVSVIASQTMLEGIHEGEWRSSRKASEHAASKAALAAEFPEGFAEVVAGGSMSQMMKTKTGAIQGIKRKAEAVTAPDSKSNLCRSVQLLMQRPLTKEDIFYETSGLQDGTFVSILTLSGYGGQQFTGIPAPNKKEAEQHAAQRAIDELAHLVEPADEERKARLREKRQKVTIERKGGMQQGGGMQQDGGMQEMPVAESEPAL